MSSCQMQQRGVCHLPVANNFRHQCLERSFCQRRCALCIVMMGMSNETVEQMHSGLAINGNANNLRIQREPRKARLCEQAGGPSRDRITGKPAMCRIMIRMVAPRQSQQHVDIGQRNQKPTSSTHRRTLAESITGMSSLMTMTCRPLRTIRRMPTIESAWRNASSTNASTVLPCAAAASRACWYSLSSIVTVDMKQPPYYQNLPVLRSNSSVIVMP